MNTQPTPTKPSALIPGRNPRTNATALDVKEAWEVIARKKMMFFDLGLMPMVSEKAH